MEQVPLMEQEPVVDLRIRGWRSFNPITLGFILFVVLVWGGGAYWYTHSLRNECNQDKAQACCELGDYYLIGRWSLGIPTDKGKARTLHMKGCNLGEMESCVALDTHFPPDPQVEKLLGSAFTANALRNAEAECLRGQARSCVWLAGMLASDKRAADAQKFYKLACDNGSQEGCQKLAAPKQPEEVAK